MENRYVVYRGTDILGSESVFKSDSQAEALKHAEAIELDKRIGEWWAIIDHETSEAIASSEKPLWHVLCLVHRGITYTSFEMGGLFASRDKAEEWIEQRNQQDPALIAWKLMNRSECVKESDPTVDEVLQNAAPAIRIRGEDANE